MDEKTVYLPLNTNQVLADLRANNESQLCKSKSSLPEVILKWNVLHSKFPYFIVIISVIQIIFFTKCTQYTFSKLKFTPKHQGETWRYLSYVLLHRDTIHIVLNIVIQCLVAALLECEQGSLRVAVVYLIAGLAGSVGTELIDPTLSLVGCSAGVYALLMSHIPNNVINSDLVRYKSYRTISVFTLCVGDILYYLLCPAHDSLPTISWASHLTGALSGLLIGFLIYTNHIRNCIYFVRFTIFILLLMSVLCFIVYSGYLISFVSV